jgi:hypothetical protein
MRLLIADLVRRMWRKAAFFGAMIAGVLSLSDAASAPFVFGFSMGIAFAMGPGVALRDTPRPIRYLPIAKRDIWRAGWLVATVGTTLLTTAAKLAGILVPQVRNPVGLWSIALSSVYDFAYAGAGCALVILAHRPGPTSGPWRWTSGVVKTLAVFALGFGLPLALWGALALGPVLPTHWTDLTPRSLAVLVAALGVAVATYFHSPGPPIPANRIAPQARAKAGTQGFEPGGLSGLPRLLAHEAVWTLIVGAVLVGGSALFVFVAARVTQSPEGLTGLLRSALLRLDEGRVSPEPAGGLDAFILLIGFAVFVTSLIARFSAMLRHLRVLPLGGARLNTLLLAWPAAVWLIAWTGLLTLHYAVLGQGVASYHADALLGLIGVSAIVQSLTLRLSRYLRTLTLALLLVIVPLQLFLDTPPPAVSVAIGLGGFAVAAVLNRRALARRSTYTPIGPAVIGGVPMF